MSLESRIAALEARTSGARPVELWEFVDALEAVELALRAGVPLEEINAELVRRWRGCPPDVRAEWLAVEAAHPASERMVRLTVASIRSRWGDDPPRPLRPVPPYPLTARQCAELHRIGDARLEGLLLDGFDPRTVALFEAVSCI